MIRNISKLGKPVNASIIAQPSKAHTLRAIIVASLAGGKSVIEKPLLADDQLAAIKAMRRLGAKIIIQEKELVIIGIPKFKKIALNAGSSGFLARALLAIATASGEGITVDASPQMRKRPISELCLALSQLGAKIIFLRKPNHFPAAIKGPLKGGKIVLDAGKSSQFLSAILLAAPLASASIEITAKNLVSGPYVNITLEIMEKFGVKVQKRGNEFKIAPQKYMPTNMSIEGDYSSAAFFMELAAITGGKVKIAGLSRETKQGDKAILPILEKMGCNIHRSRNTVEVTGPKILKPVIFNMKNFPDLAVPIAVTAAFANGTSILQNIGQLKFKESDRLEAIKINLGKMGVKVEERNGNLAIHGNSNAHGATINPFNDHRIAMAFAIAGLRTGNMKIRNAECVRKSFPTFWKEIEKLF
ncbi:MAG: 3-phosphoshikimate 1-carboxyvinyltransferase [Candidatus Micrarchaeota archaeon]